MEQNIKSKHTPIVKDDGSIMSHLEVGNASYWIDCWMLVVVWIWIVSIGFWIIGVLIIIFRGW